MASRDLRTRTPYEYNGEDFFPDEIPEQLKDNCLVEYFRSRYDKRTDCLEKFDEDSRKLITAELERIKELRKKFEEEARNKSDMDLFIYYQAVWRNHAIRTRQEHLVSLDDKLQGMIKMKHPKLTEAQLPRRKDLETRILKAIEEKWVQQTLPRTPTGIGGQQEPSESSNNPTNFLSRLKRKFKKEAPKAGPTPSEHLETKTGSSREFSPLPQDGYGIAVTEISLTRKEDGHAPFFKLEKTQRYPLKQIIEDKMDDNGAPGTDHPLRKVDGIDRIRYFHIPANNMHWVEEAIARYYGETTPGEFNYRKAKDYCEKSSNILCRRYWTSLQHGGVYDPVHARHLRSHCSLITPETASSADQIKGSKNFIMFMPYLHWETHRRRKKMAEIIKEITNQYHRDRSHVTESLREELAEVTKEIMIRHARQLTDLPYLDGLSAMAASKRDTKKPKRSALGQYLLQSAKIYGMMDIEPDVRILRDHLHKDPPLHARRTLDQSYYWKLPTTDGRDEDQVVYRETKIGKSILRTSRVVMVDQLWLYILDDNTILTSFPRRWGRNKPDWSGVHKAIRSRLDHLRDGEIQSVYDLALMIIDQCSAVFFDRTKPVDERPEVLDIFSNALSHVSGMKTIAFETFWRQLNRLSASDHQQEDFEATARTYLNINPEFELLRESHDIIEELRMMVGIFNQQIHVIEEFSRHLQNLHEKETMRESSHEDSSPSVLKVMMDIKKLLEDRKLSDDAKSHGNGTAALNGSVALDRNSPPVKTIPKNTLHLAKDVSREIAHRKQELEKLEKSTGSVCDQLKSLLDLKQQQASIIEAKYALKRADESVIQGRSIILFTIVTIIFLPLSFMTSVFGMNARELSGPNGGIMSLNQQFKYALPISLAVIMVSIALAFSTWIRSIISFAANILWALIFEYTSLRKAWNRATKNHNSDALYGLQQKWVEKIHSRKERKAMMADFEKAKQIELTREEGNRGGSGGGAGGRIANGTAVEMTPHQNGGLVGPSNGSARLSEQSPV